MPITRDELESFHRFAGARLENGGASSLEDCLRQWRAAREEEEAVADIVEGMEDIQAGRVYRLDEVGAEIREHFGVGAQGGSA